MLAWKDGTVAKIFNAQYAFAAGMEWERVCAVHALGAPCPAPLGRVEHDGRPGIEFERIDGPLLLDSLRDGSASAAEVAERMAELHVQLHALRVPPDSTLPRLRDWIRRWLARGPDGVRERGEAELEQLPHEEGLCHGDLHPGNVIISGGRLVVVDWVNASAGPLALDVARSYVLLAWQGAKRREGRRQAARLELAARYREAMAARVAPADFERALGFAADALLFGEPENAFAAELQSATPWR